VQGNKINYFVLEIKNTADCEGSSGARRRLFKKELQKPDSQTGYKTFEEIIDKRANYCGYLFIQNPVTVNVSNFHLLIRYL
jgi:hypothetical protein